MSLEAIRAVKLTHKETKEVMIYKLNEQSLYDISYNRNNHEWSETMNDWLNVYDQEDIHILYDHKSGCEFELTPIVTMN